MKISAIVPAYNAEKYLERAVNSIIDTKYPELEILIVNDGSQDKTAMVARKLQDQFPQYVRILSHSDGDNHGVSASRNLGILESTGELICFLDADDYVFPFRFETAIRILQGNKEIDGVFDRTEVVFESTPGPNIIWDELYRFGISQPVSGLQLLATLLQGGCWATSALLVRKELIEKTGFFRHDLKHAEDIHLWFRMAAVGRLVAGDLDRPVSAYYRHNDNTYRGGLEGKIGIVKVMVDIYRWTRKQALSPEIQKVFRDGVSRYVINSIIAARESGRADVARRIMWTAVRNGFPAILREHEFLRQGLAMVKENVPWRAGKAPGKR